MGRFGVLKTGEQSRGMLLVGESFPAVPGETGEENT